MEAPTTEAARPEGKMLSTPLQDLRRMHKKTLKEGPYGKAPFFLLRVFCGNQIGFC